MIRQKKINYDKIPMEELGIPTEMMAIMPIIVAWPDEKIPESPRNPAEIQTWK